MITTSNQITTHLYILSSSSRNNNNNNNLFNCSSTATPAWLEEEELDALPDGNSRRAFTGAISNSLGIVLGWGRVGWEVDLGGWVQVVGRYGVGAEPGMGRWEGK